MLFCKTLYRILLGFLFTFLLRCDSHSYYSKMKWIIDIFIKPAHWVQHKQSRSTNSNGVLNILIQALSVSNEILMGLWWCFNIFTNKSKWNDDFDGKQWFQYKTVNFRGNSRQNSHSCDKNFHRPSFLSNSPLAMVY